MPPPASTSERRGPSSSPAASEVIAGASSRRASSAREEVEAGHAQRQRGQQPALDRQADGHRRAELLSRDHRHHRAVVGAVRPSTLPVQTMNMPTVPKKWRTAGASSACSGRSVSCGAAAWTAPVSTVTAPIPRRAVRSSAFSSPRLVGRRQPVLREPQVRDALEPFRRGAPAAP